jgi:hypothetical protein
MISNPAEELMRPRHAVHNVGWGPRIAFVI